MSLRHRLQAWGELLGRYRRAWAHAWSHRRELTPPAHTAEEAEFLPAALSLQARPVSPSGRWTARLLMLLVLALLAWSVIGRTDIVVNAQGRIESYSNVLPSYFMAHVIYKLNIQPKKK